MVLYRGVKNLFFGVAMDQQRPVDPLKDILTAGKIFGIGGHKFREELMHLLVILLQKVDGIHFWSPWFDFPMERSANRVPSAWIPLCPMLGCPMLGCPMYMSNDQMTQ